MWGTGSKPGGGGMQRAGARKRELKDVKKAFSGRFV